MAERKKRITVRKLWICNKSSIITRPRKYSSARGNFRLALSRTLKDKRSQETWVGGQLFKSNLRRKNKKCVILEMAMRMIMLTSNQEQLYWVTEQNVKMGGIGHTGLYGRFCPFFCFLCDMLSSHPITYLDSLPKKRKREEADCNADGLIRLQSVCWPLLT